MANARNLRILGLDVGWPFETTYTGLVLGTTGYLVAGVFQPYSLDPIIELGWRVGTVTGTPVAHRVSLQGVDLTTGQPNGTVLGGGSPASVSVTPVAGDQNKTRWYTLDNAYTPPNYNPIAMVYEVTGTPAGNTIAVTYDTKYSVGFVGFGYMLTYDGAWTKRSSGRCMAWGTAAGRFGYELFETLYQTNTTTAGHRQALHFTLEGTHGSTFVLSGFRGYFRTPGAGGNMLIKIWSTSGVIDSVTHDSDILTVNSNNRECRFVFPGGVVLNFGTKYYIGVEHDSSAVGLRGLQLGYAASRNIYPYGLQCGLSTYNGSVWTDDNTVMPFARLIMGDWTVPSPGGGGLARIIGG